MKKLILLLAAVGMFLEMPSKIWAAVGHIADATNYYLTPGTYSSWADGSSAVYNINSSGEYHFSGTIQYYATFVVNADNVTIYLENFSMLNGGFMESGYTDGFQIYGSSVELILVGESTIKSYYGDPVDVKSTGSLTISSENDGLLNLDTSGYLALRSDGTTTIDGGIVIADGGSANSAIGGSGELIVNGGTLNATGGGGKSGSGISLGSVTVNGGSVTANGHNSGAGVVADSVSVTGGSLTANGGSTGVGVNAGSLSVTGGLLTANGGSTDGAGIDAENVSVNGGSVVAEGHGSAAGIDSDNIVVGGGLVSAKSESGTAFSSTPANASGATLYCVTLPDATAVTSPLFSLFSVSGGTDTFTYTVTKPSNYSYSYSGSGLEGTNDLYFYLPNGTYVITGSDAAQGRQYGGTVNGAPITFEVIPEPACGAGLLFAVLALCLKNRKNSIS